MHVASGPPRMSSNLLTPLHIKDSDEESGLHKQKFRQAESIPCLLGGRKKKSRVKLRANVKETSPEAIDDILERVARARGPGTPRPAVITEQAC